MAALDDDLLDTTRNLENDPAFKEAKQRVTRFVNGKKKTTIGAISREFPEYGRFLIQLLFSLRLEGNLDFDDFCPPPTKVLSMAKVSKGRKEQMKKAREVNSKVQKPDRRRLCDLRLTTKRNPPTGIGRLRSKKGVT